MPKGGRDVSQQQNDDNPGNDNQLGALIAEDTVKDELETIDQRNRFPATNLFAIYGSHTTLASSMFHCW